jgi:hypothetical protein
MESLLKNKGAKEGVLIATNSFKKSLEKSCWKISYRWRRF